MKPSKFNDEIPEEAEIEIAVLGLKGGRSRGSSDMNTMDLKGYQQKANREKDSKGRRWEPVVILV